MSKMNFFKRIRTAFHLGTPTKENRFDSNLCFDSVPSDSPINNNNVRPHNAKVENNSRGQTEALSKSKNDKEYSNAQVSDDEERKDERASSTTSENNSPSSEQENWSENGYCTTKHETHICVNGNGIGLVLGTVNQQNIYGAPETEVADKHKTYDASVKRLFKSETKLHRENGELSWGHLQFLAQHFKSGWKKIGSKIGLSARELDIIEEDCRDREEKAYQTLKVWCEKSGTDATVGRLCKCLWKTKVPEGQEAVRKLSINIDNIE